MDLHNYWVFVGACLLLVIVPAPDMIYLLERSLAQGKKAGIAAALDINAGGYFHLLAAVLGISSVIATSAVAFTFLKWCGAIYLVYLGFQAIFSNQIIKFEQQGRRVDFNSRTLFYQGFISDVLNPKVAIFFIALLPQFVQVEAGNLTGQLLILGVTVNVIALFAN